MNKKLLFTFIAIIASFISTQAQDSWTRSEPGGFGLTYNEFITHMLPFKGNIYASSGTNAGGLYRSASGTQGTWSNMLSGPNIRTFDALSSTTEGGGYMYASFSSSGFDSSRVYRSFDGVTWTPYFTGNYDPLAHVVPFKGSGSVDSMYVIDNYYYGARIYRSGYATNDPANTSGSWQNVFNFDTASYYTQVTSTLVHSGRFYIGTGNGAQLWSSMDGTTWTKNDSVGFGFGDGNNSEITALEAFGGYIYAGTRCYTGAQLWRTPDQLNWTLVKTYPGTDEISDLEVSGSELWIAAENGTSGGGIIDHTTDGSTFITSNNNGFGEEGNHGEGGNFTVFGNNIYYGVRNYAFAALVADPGLAVRDGDVRGGGGGSTGGQIWRKCLITPPILSLGNDTTICTGLTVTLDAGPGALAYNWSTGETTQSITAGVGSYTCQITTASGCDASDVRIISENPAPTLSIQNPIPGPPLTLCAGTTLPVIAMATSGLYVIDPPFNKTTYDTIDYTLGDNFDTLAVSGVTGSCACTSLVSVTIDSLEHEYLSDVIIGLYSPSGSYIDLVAGGYGGGSDAGYYGTEFRMDAPDFLYTGSPPYTGLFLPDGDFGTLAGNPNGNWVLKVGDIYGSDNGNLKGWTLKFGYADTIMTYSWTPATGLTSSSILNPVITAVATTNYALTVTNTAGCASTDTVKIIVPSIDMIVGNDSLCYGTNTSLVGSGGVNYIWSPGAYLSSTTGTAVTTMTSISRMFYVTDTVGGCYAIDSAYININSMLTANAGADQNTCYGQSVTLNGTGTSGGTLPYNYVWSDGVTSPTGANPVFTPLVTTTYTLGVTDAFGCTAIDYVNANVTPSTNVVGHAGYSGGNVTSGNAVAYKYIPSYTYFDTVQVAPLNAAGNFTFTALNSSDYLIKIFADTLLYPTLDATYYGNAWAWDSALVLNHGCSMIDTANVTMIEELGLTGGPGSLRGRIVEDFGFGGSMMTAGGGGRMLPGEPIPGIDVKLGKNPGGALMGSTTTSDPAAADGGGYYYFTNIPLNSPGGSYTIYVDIPGLERDSSYTVTLDATTSQYIYLDYIVDSTSIFIVPNAGVGISNPDVTIENKFGVYPNPARRNATIEYSIEKDAAVSLTVYNVMGEKVNTLVNTKQTAGTYKYNLNSLNAGVYFITLNVNNNVTTQRLVVVE